MSFLLSPTRRAGFAGSALASRTFSTTRPSQLARMTLVGRLGTDPELVDVGKTQLVRYVVGSSSGPKDNKQTSWFRVASFAPEGPQRDYILGLSKGTLVYLEGDATMRIYEDADGKKQSALSLVQTKLDVLKRSQSKEDDVGGMTGV
ncbi:ssDNA-binding protein, mitochondrial [Exophiala xenobiotica]|uniref:SsDNA-binding protein, mitochondrial n=1 Tax=Vermiconidia calcicola TaxID=1690605 RepID=A0AAV9QGX9_9PEZI|nr:ssDNA-binding protein, mitochondrial [Exophiala xenobiotica]KAK5539215.1 ssDNA-binding protein, mitochondrial [Chaetothyriales sp. CCFEE 6169]KAK5542573.1 ssDNA-binding protein, mitochondrial [Vermiconidia calcicola]KAK5195565.1 ssDNA-binding protein, mitochondrial [Exophiala xenobiotica]KAK5211812.1 ssDNA-binding protein, mitochondrial [Exophiala xenobiotica]